MIITIFNNKITLYSFQLQSQGVQFYLGTFDSEIEAAHAYDRKVIFNSKLLLSNSQYLFQGTWRKR